jgi:hypothetical protein
VECARKRPVFGKTIDSVEKKDAYIYRKLRVSTWDQSRMSLQLTTEPKSGQLGP